MSHQASDIITPKALLLDERLTPLERNAWLTFRSLASSDGTVVLSYDALRQYLPSAPGSKRAALETVSRAVLCLRLSTWIALIEYRRNPMTGFSMASRYAVRNQPLAFDDACMEDEDYGRSAMPARRFANWRSPFSMRPCAIRTGWKSCPQRCRRGSGVCSSMTMTMIWAILVAQLRAIPSCPKPAAAFRNPFRHSRQQYVL
ncbi:hypothetical protein ACF6JE_001945 [Pseudomonas aeruginosa]